MKKIKNMEEAKAFRVDTKIKNLSLGLVPTMGNLHWGHLSLVKASKQDNDITVASIFVNPTQFSGGEDFNEYPRTLESDLIKLADLGTDAVFMPDFSDVYSGATNVFIDEDQKAGRLCGRFRPGHFNGVLTVVSKLLNLFLPNRAYFGLKDYQQYLLVRDMSASLNIDTEIVSCPIVREESGLAMSSRNNYLTSEQKVRSSSINSSLIKVKEAFDRGLRDIQVLKSIALKELMDNSITVQYVEIVDSDSLSSAGIANKGNLVAIAGFCDEVRLIDNIIL